jgi:hypothetical protein
VQRIYPRSERRKSVPGGSERAVLARTVRAGTYASRAPFLLFVAICGGQAPKDRFHYVHAGNIHLYFVVAAALGVV